MQISTLSFPIPVLFCVLSHQIISQCFLEFSSSLSVHYQHCVSIWAHNMSKVMTSPLMVFQVWITSFLVRTCLLSVTNFSGTNNPHSQRLLFLVHLVFFTARKDYVSHGFCRYSNTHFGCLVSDEDEKSLRK